MVGKEKKIEERAPSFQAWETGWIMMMNYDPHDRM